MENNLPNGWEKAPLEELASYVIGGDWGKEIPESGFERVFVLRGTDYRHWETLRAKGSAIRYFKKQSVEKRQLIIGDIILEVSGGGPDQPVGRVVIIDDKALNSVPGKLSFSNFFRLLRIDQSINPFFVRYFLNHAYSRGDFNEMQSHTTNLRNLRVNEFLEKTRIPIPPRNEQDRLVKRLDELMEKIDRSRVRLERIPQILKRFRQSVLAAAVSGKLTEEWREKNRHVEPVNLNAINLEREKLQRGKALENGRKSFSYKQPVKIEIGERTKGVEELFDIPKSWKWTTLDHTVWSISDGPHFSPKYVGEKEGVAFISSRNISYSGIDFSDAKYVSRADHLNFIKRGRPEIGDVLLTKGGTTGVAHVVKSRVEFSIWVHVALLKVIKRFIDSDYLRDVLTTDFLYRQSQAQTHGVGNQDLGLTRMIFMTIPLPPKEEQIEIVKKIARYFSLADKIDARFKKAKAQLDELPQSLLAKAFRGELVGQEANDEPASVLLDRILSQKRNSKSPKKTQKAGREYELEGALALAAEGPEHFKKVKK